MSVCGLVGEAVVDGGVGAAVAGGTVGFGVDKLVLKHASTCFLFAKWHLSRLHFNLNIVFLFCRSHCNIQNAFDLMLFNSIFQREDESVEINLTRWQGRSGQHASKILRTCEVALI